MTELLHEEGVKLKKIFRHFFEVDDTIPIGGIASQEEKINSDPLSRLLKGAGKLFKDGGTNGKAISTEAKAVHTANVMRIYNLVDKIEKGEVTDDVEFCPDGSATSLPDLDRWDFQLGDKVLVDLSLATFKLMQKQSLGWRKVLGNVCGRYGWVTDIKSSYENGVQVYFPAVYTSTTVYAGALSKTEKKFHVVPSRWKFGDYVKTKKNKELVKKFQRRLPDIPERYIGKKGRVIVVTDVSIFVTFNESSSCAVHPALLQPLDDTSPIEVAEPICHPKRFRIGEKVHVIRNLKRLFSNQNRAGGWNRKMCDLVGKTVTITHIKKDGSLKVALKNQGSWRLNYDSVYKDNNDVPIIAEEEFQFLPGDKVCVKLTKNIKMELVSAKLLESCLDFLKITAIVDSIDVNEDVVVRFNSEGMPMKASLLRKATKAEEEKCEYIERKRRCLTPGDRVRFDIGPPRYVRDILTKSQANSGTISRLTEPTELVGFVSEDHAVISYEDGKRVKVNKKYLSPAEKYEHNLPNIVDFKFLEELLSTLRSCVEAIHLQLSEDPEDDVVNLYSITSGVPPTICFKVSSTLATPKMIFDRLKDITGWEMSWLCDNEFCVKAVDSDEESTIVLLTHHWEPSNKLNDLDDAVVTPKPEDLPSKQQSVHSEHPEAKDKTEPFVDPPAAPQGIPIHHPNITDFGQFRFVAINTAGGTLYIPYIPEGHVGGPEHPAQANQGGEHQAEQNPQNIFNVYGQMIQGMNVFNA